MKRILQVFIVLIPLLVSFSTTDPTLHIRFLVLSIFVALSLLLFLINNKKICKAVLFHPLAIAFLILIVGYLVSTFYHGFGSESIYILSKMLLLYLFMIISTHLVLEYGFKEFIKSFVLFSFLASSIYIFQFFLYFERINLIENPLQRNIAFDNISGTMGHKNLLSSILFLTLPFVIYLIRVGKKLWRLLSIVLLACMLLIILQTQTRAVFVALGLFVITIAIVYKSQIKLKQLSLLLGSVIVGLSLFFTILKYTDRYDALVHEMHTALDYKNSLRYKLYKSSFYLISKNPLLGVGPGNWRLTIPKYGLYFDSFGTNYAQRPHNDFLWVFAEGGLIPGISFILIFLILLRDSYYLHKNNKKSSLFYSLLFATFIGFSFISLVDFPLERFSHNIIFFFLAAIIIAGKLKHTGYKKELLPKWLNFSFLGVVFFVIYVAVVRYQGEVYATNAINFQAKQDWSSVVGNIDKAYNKTYYELENTSTPLLWYRGVAYFNQQRSNLALKDFKEAYKVHPYHEHVLNNLASSYEMTGNHLKAKQFYLEALRVNPTFKEVRINLAAILYNEKNYIQALDIILNSLVLPFQKRKETNDNYDLYLKTIFKGWANSVSDLSSEKQKMILNDMLNRFEENPQQAEKIMRKAIQRRTTFNLDYLSILENMFSKINLQIDKIKNNKDWYHDIKIKSLKNNISIEDQLFEDALFLWH